MKIIYAIAEIFISAVLSGVLVRPNYYYFKKLNIFNSERHNTLFARLCIGIFLFLVILYSIPSIQSIACRASNCEVKLKDVRIAWNNILGHPNDATKHDELLKAVEAIRWYDTVLVTGDQRDELAQAQAFATGLNLGLPGWNDILAKNPPEPLAGLVQQQRDQLIADQQREKPKALAPAKRDNPVSQPSAKPEVSDKAYKGNSVSSPTPEEPIKCGDRSAFDAAQGNGYFALKAFFRSCPSPDLSLAERGSAAFSDFGNDFYNKNRDILTAIEAENLAVQLNPRNANAHVDLGKMLIESGDEAGGMAETYKSIEIDPDNAMAHYNLATILEERKQYTDSIKEYKVAIHLQPAFTIAYNNLGLALHENKQDDEAIIAFEKAIELRANFTEAYNGLCNSYRSKGDFEHAIANCKKAISSNPKDWRPYNNLGVVYDAMRNYPAAVDQFRSALRLNPDDAVIEDNLRSTIAKIPQPK